MTMYTEDVNYRLRTLFAVLVALSIIGGFALQNAIPQYPRLIVPATFMIFGAIFWLFDAFLWKVPGIRILNSGIPLLAGIWKGSITRDVQGRSELLDAELIVKQTWSKLELILKTSECVSRNVLVGFTLANPGGILLTWIYQIDQTEAASVTEHGRGIVELTLHRNENAFTFDGAFIASACGEPVNLKFIKSGFTFWNPKPF